MSEGIRRFSVENASGLVMVVACTKIAGEGGDTGSGGRLALLAVRLLCECGRQVRVLMRCLRVEMEVSSGCSGV